jgi:hypothetical protein
MHLMAKVNMAPPLSDFVDLRGATIVLGGTRKSVDPTTTAGPNTQATPDPTDARRLRLPYQHPWIDAGSEDVTSHKTRVANALAELPPVTTTHWSTCRKAAVVAAVREGVLTLEEACRRYQLSVEEFTSWQRLVDRHGLPISTRSSRSSA